MRVVPPTLRAFGIAAALLACGPDEDPEVDDTDLDTDPPAVSAEPRVALAYTLGFLRADEGISDGFDLDGSEASGDDPCGKQDFVAPDGRGGIDNAFSGLLPIIEGSGGQALGELIQNAVNSGELLLLVEVDGLEEAKPGDEITMRIVRGLGQPALGPDGLILPSQTFDRNPEFPEADLTRTTLQADGSILGEGFNLRLPLAVFDESIDLTLHDGRVMLVPNEDGSWQGTIGGAVETQEIADNVYGFDAVPDILVSSITGALDIIADLSPGDDGTCQQMSVTLGFRTVPAFFYADALDDTGTAPPE